MVLRLPTRTPSEYETHVVAFLQNETRFTPHNVLFLNCGSAYTRYLVSREDLKGLFDSITTLTIDSFPPLHSLIHSRRIQSALSGKRFVIISPYYHLLEDLSPREQKKTLNAFEAGLERFEQKTGIHVIVAAE